MEENNQTIIDIKIPDALIASLKLLREEYAKNTEQLQKYNEQLENGTITQEEYDKAVIEVTQEQKVLRQEISGVEKQMQNEIKAQKANTDSLVQMRAQLANLNKQYDSMSGFERMGVEGLALRDKIAALSEKIQDLEADTGRWQRNVGNYKSALKGMKDATEAAGLSSKGLDRIMKGLSANPWMTVVTFLVTILVKLRDRLKDNEKVTTSLGNAMSSLQPIFDWFSKIISKIADIFSNVLDWAIQKVIQSLGWLGRQLQKLGQAFGKDWGGGLIEYSNNMQKTAEKTEEATEATETFTASVSKMKQEVKETNDELAKTPELLDELLAKFLEQEKQAKAAAQRLEDLKRMYEAMGLTFEDTSKIYAEGMRVTMPEMVELRDTSTKQMAEWKKAFDDNAKDIETTATSLQSTFNSLSSIYKQMSEDETKSEEERARAAKAASRWAKLQIAANSGTALAKGISGAMDAPTVAGKIAALATLMSAILSAITQAKALAAEGHAGGGVIGGTFTGATRGGDNVVMTGRRSELVLNADQQKRLFDIANGSPSPSMGAELAAALRAMPAPKLVLQELKDYQGKVVTFDETQLIH